MESLYTTNKYFCTARKIRTILSWVTILLLFFTLASCEQKTPEPVQLRALSAREYYPQALERAQQWRPDVYLEYISMNVLSKEDFTRRLLVLFIFKSPSDERHSLSITFWEGSGEPAVESTYHEIANSVHNPILSEDWPLDSLDVLLIAQLNGGDKFLLEHNPEMTSITLFLERMPNMPEVHPRWRALFWVSQESVQIIVDPQTGKVVEVEWDPPR